MSDYLFIIAPLTGWVVAQALKVCLELRKDGVQLRDAWASGGMPSSHSAGIVALTTSIGIEQGITSAIFGLALTVSAVILYDSVGVRRAAGESTMAIKELESKLKIRTKQKIHLAKGHTPQQVIGGVFLGVLIGAVLTKLL